MAIRVPLVVNLSGPDGDNAAPESPEVRSPSRSNMRRRATNATMKALVSMMGQRKQEMKALAYDATFQEFQQRAAADASAAAASSHSPEPPGHEVYVLSDAPMASTLELISRAGKAQNRTQAGVWSAFGKSYVCLGTPDVALSDMPPVKRGDHARQPVQESKGRSPDTRNGNKSRGKGRQKQTAHNDQPLSQTASKSSSSGAEDSRRGLKEEESSGAGKDASLSQSLPQLVPFKSRRRDRIPFSEILFPREQIHVADRSKRNARARACIMGIGPGQKSEDEVGLRSLTEADLPSSTLLESQQKTHTSRSALIQQALLKSHNLEPVLHLVINVEPLRLPPPQLQHQTSVQTSRRSSKRGSSAPGSPHSAGARRASHARFGGASPKPSALAALSPVAQFMLSCASGLRSPRNQRPAGAPLLRESSILGHAAMLGPRKLRAQSTDDALEKKEVVAAPKRPVSSLSLDATVPRLRTDFDAVRNRMRDDLKARLELLKGRRERCILSPRFMGTVSKLLVSQIRNVGRSYPINTKLIWDLAESSLQESADMLRARKEDQQSNALNVFYTQLCALVQSQNTTDPIMIQLCQKVRSLLENGWTLQRPFLVELCRYIAHVEEASVFGSNPCLLPVLHFIRRRLCLPVPELTRILREAGIVFGSVGRLRRETGTLGNMTLQKLKPV